MLLRKFKRNLMSLHYSLFALIVFVIVYTLEPGECHTTTFGNSLTRLRKADNGLWKSNDEFLKTLRTTDFEHSDITNPLPVEIASSFAPISRRKDGILSRKKRTPSSERRKSKNGKRSQEAESERNSAGAIALAMLKMYMNSDNQDDKGKNPLDMYNMQISKFVQDKMKRLRKSLRNAFKKFRECITLFPFSIDRSCLK